MKMQIQREWFNILCAEKQTDMQLLLERKNNYQKLFKEPPRWRIVTTSHNRRKLLCEMHLFRFSAGTSSVKNSQQRQHTEFGGGGSNIMLRKVNNKLANNKVLASKLGISYYINYVYVVFAINTQFIPVYFSICC